MKVNETIAAEHTGLQPHTLANQRARDDGPPYYKIGGRVLYDLDELNEWLRSKRVDPAARKRRDSELAAT